MIQNMVSESIGFERAAMSNDMRDRVLAYLVLNMAEQNPIVHPKTIIGMALCHLDVICDNGWLSHCDRIAKEGLGIPDNINFGTELRDFVRHGDYETGRRNIEKGIREALQIKGFIK